MFFYDFLKNYKYLNYFIEVRNFLKMYSVLHPEKNVRSGGSSIALVVLYYLLHNTDLALCYRTRFMLIWEHFTFY